MSFHWYSLSSCFFSKTKTKANRLQSQEDSWSPPLGRVQKVEWVQHRHTPVLPWVRRRYFSLVLIPLTIQFSVRDLASIKSWDKWRKTEEGEEKEKIYIIKREWIDKYSQGSTRETNSVKSRQKEDGRCYTDVGRRYQRISCISRVFEHFKEFWIRPKSR